MKNIKNYIEEEIKKVTKDLENLEEIEKTRKLLKEEEKYKNMLYGSWFTLLDLMEVIK